MGLFKFQNYSAIKNAQDNPRVKAVVDTVNGNVFTIGDNVNVGGVNVKEAQVLFEDAEAAQAGNIWVMNNIVDKPEIRNYADYKVEAGEDIRAFKLDSQIGEIVELSGDLVIADDVDPIVAGTYLVPTNQDDDADDEQMLWKSVYDASDYAIYLEVLEVTTFGLFTIDNSGKGYECKIKANDIVY